MAEALLGDAKIFLFLLTLAIFLILTDNSSLYNLPKSAVQAVTLPIQYGLYRSAEDLGKQLSFVFLVRKTAQEKNALEEQLAQVLSENAALRKKVAEYQALDAQQKAINLQNFTLIAAHPVGISRYLYIDQGSERGITPGQAVIFKDNYLGKVVSVGPKKSRVMLLTDPDSRIAAFSSAADGKARGVLSGQFGSEMLLDKVLHQEPIKSGDLIYSEGTEVGIPRGLVLGQVSEVLNRDNEIFKQAKVKSIFNVSNLDLVFVITN